MNNFMHKDITVHAEVITALWATITAKGAHLFSCSRVSSHGRLERAHACMTSRWQVGIVGDAFPIGICGKQ